MRRKFPIYRQLDKMDCGPTCLKMIAAWYGKHYSLQTLRDQSYMTREGVNLKNISDLATKMGFRTVGAKLSFEQLDSEATLPCILYWNQNHFVVLPPQDYNSRRNGKILVADPAYGLVKVDKATFLKAWIRTADNCGIALLMSPTASFYDNEGEKKEVKSFSFLLNYVRPYKYYFLQLLLGMIVGSVLSLIAPFLTQALVDYGINQQHPEFVSLILISQLALFAGNTAIDVIRGWLLLHIGSRINISIISDFLGKLMRLPVRFFDTKMPGDISQRIADHNKIEAFLTGTSFNTLFSLVNLVVFSVVLAVYSMTVFWVFFGGSVCAIVWILFYQQKRRELNYARFQQLTDNQNSLFEIVSGMQEIKMNNSETTFRWGWERIQAKMFKINVSGLVVNQYQLVGSNFFSQLKNILATYIAAREVLEGHMSLGMMLSVSYVIGQLNSPVDQLINFIQGAQDAKISLERLSEIHTREEEERPDELRPDHELELHKPAHLNGHHREVVEEVMPSREGIIRLQDISFQYGGPSSAYVLSNINLDLTMGKVTAIVGTSGSGKTTLMKLLLKFYEPAEGQIYIGNTDMNNVSARWWRDQCGVVMTNGYIFADTIAKNIAVQEEIDKERLFYAVRMANIEQFINNLPLGLNTKIGTSGNDISSGQKQRILIARAIYKQPKFIFLDEATSTLDANNERIIMENLQKFFTGRTVFIIAHRLSTVKNADQIVVLEKGKIVEIGNHQQLTMMRGHYFSLVKNQLELGN
ncbi:peptidase domain-containing ABC transporter [Chitinophaga sp.]|uniref:peptidase domain-containing ABC transporter n=1 Tax=Chitinophaga sp. TaxID=1869181 RepID=UPI0031DCC046